MLRDFASALLGSWSRRGVGTPALPGLVALWRNMFDTLFSRIKLPLDTWFIGLASTHATEAIVTR